MVQAIQSTPLPRRPYGEALCTRKVQRAIVFKTVDLKDTKKCSESQTSLNKKFTVSFQGSPLCVVRPCLHGALYHCQTQNKFVIRGKNDKAIMQCS